MDRGLVAPLSPNEEITLRRVAHGVVEAKTLSPAHLTRLKSLALVEELAGALSATLDASVAALAKALKVTKL